VFWQANLFLFIMYLIIRLTIIRGMKGVRLANWSFVNLHLFIVGSFLIYDSIPTISQADEYSFLTLVPVFFIWMHDSTAEAADN